MHRKAFSRRSRSSAAAAKYKFIKNTFSATLSPFSLAVRMGDVRRLNLYDPFVCIPECLLADSFVLGKGFDCAASSMDMDTDAEFH